MGLNISVYRLGETIITENWSFKDETYTEKEERPSWDFIRHFGDVEFALSGMCKPVLDEGGDDLYYRPKDFNQAREWVTNNVESNKERWFNMFDEMEKDEKLVFHFGW